MLDSNDVIYDGYSFKDNGLVLVNIDHMTVAQRENQLEQLANRNGGLLVQSRLKSKSILLEGYYDGIDRVDAQNKYDSIAQAMNRQDRTLVVPHAGTLRKYMATPENVIIKEPQGLNRLTFSIEFIVPDGNGYDSVVTTLLNQIITGSSVSLPITVNGSVVARPFTTLTFTTVTGGTAKTVTFRNARDYIGLIITRNFVSGDQITIDSDNYQIYINGVLTEPVGRFPKWEPGGGAMFYSDSFSSRSVTIQSTYTRKDL